MGPISWSTRTGQIVMELHRSTYRTRPGPGCNHVRNILQVSHSRGIPAHRGFFHARGGSAARERKTIIKAQVRAVRRLLTPRPTDPPPSLDLPA